ncbi:hypothetical protein COO60DRAFT_488738 [Scenedesmus sp. NREL 46B-D3]|nr:hypothetical protein COO60DRAFT_488738 [Scenedesmus sp. NREL 46B-D3]
MVPDSPASFAAAAATAASPSCLDFSRLTDLIAGLPTNTQQCLLPFSAAAGPTAVQPLLLHHKGRARLPAGPPAKLLPAAAAAAPRSAELLLLCGILEPAPGDGLAPRLMLMPCCCCCCCAVLLPPASGGFRLVGAGLKFDGLKLVLMLMPGTPPTPPPTVPAGEPDGAALPVPTSDPAAPPAEASAELQLLEGADGSLLCCSMPSLSSMLSAPSCFGRCCRHGGIGMREAPPCSAVDSSVGLLQDGVAGDDGASGEPLHAAAVMVQVLPPLTDPRTDCAPDLAAAAQPCCCGASPNGEVMQMGFSWLL